MKKKKNNKNGNGTTQMDSGMETHFFTRTRRELFTNTNYDRCQSKNNKIFPCVTIWSSHSQFFLFIQFLIIEIIKNKKKIMDVKIKLIDWKPTSYVRISNFNKSKIKYLTIYRINKIIFKIFSVHFSLFHFFFLIQILQIF